MKLMSATIVAALLSLSINGTYANTLSPAQQEEVKIKSGKWMEQTTEATKLTKNRQFEQAEKIYKSMIAERQALGLDLSSQQDDLGWLYYKWGKRQLAEQMFKDLLADRGKTAGMDQGLLSYPLHEYASFLQKVGRASEAKKMLDRARTIDALSDSMPQLPPIAKGLTSEQKLAEAKTAGDLGAKLLEAGLQHKAFVYLNRAIELNPKDAVAFCNRGDAEHWMDKFPQSEQDFNTAIRLKPDYAEAYKKRANVHIDMKQYPKALDDFAKAFQIDPKDAESIGNRAKLLDTMGQHQKAVVDYTKSIAVNPELTWPYVQRAIAYDALRQTQKAIDDYTVLCSRYPQSYDYFELRGAAYLKSHKLKEALVDYDKVIALNPKYSLGYVQRSKVYEQLDGKKSPRAVADLKKAKSLGYGY